MQDEEELFDRTDDVSLGKNADPPKVLEGSIPKDLLEKFEVHSYRNAANILRNSFPEHFDEILSALRAFQISTTEIRTPGGSKSLIAKYVDTLFSGDWRETRISADLHVKLQPPKGTEVFATYVREGFLDGHRIDFVKGRVALDLEWNSKDQTYDRDLYAFSAFYDAGAIDVAVIITRGSSLNNSFFRSLGKVLSKDGCEGSRVRMH